MCAELKIVQFCTWPSPSKKKRKKEANKWKLVDDFGHRELSDQAPTSEVKFLQHHLETMIGIDESFFPISHGQRLSLAFRWFTRFSWNYFAKTAPTAQVYRQKMILETNPQLIWNLTY